MNTTENNKLIAEFMKLPFEYNTSEGAYYNKENGDLIGIELSYHTSWEWLMPVIRRLNEVVDIKKGEEGIVNGLIMGDIEYTYSHLVNCIKWYNNRKDIEDNMAHDFDREPNF